MSGSINQLIAGGGVQANPLAMAGNVLDFARGAQTLKTQQFELQQSQLQPAYQAMRQVMATNPNPTWDDVNAALAQSKRIGGNVDGLVANAAETASKGGSPGDFVRATALGGMSPENQVNYGVGAPVSQDTGGNVVYGMRGGPLSSTPGQFTGVTSIQKGFTPAESGEFISVPDQDANGNATGTYHLVPRGTLFGTGVPGGGGGPAGGGAAPSAGGPGGGAVALGMRQNNPGNLMFAGQPGAAPGQGNRFASFPDMPTGVAANVAQLIANQDNHGINTVAGQVNRWVSDPNANLSSYVADISNALGVKPTDPVNFHDPAVLQKYIMAMQPHESGGGGAVLSPNDVSAGVQMALGSGGSRFPPGSYQVASNAPVSPPTGGGGNVQQAGGVQQLDPTGRPIAQGGGGGPVLHPLSPYQAPQFEQSAKDYVHDQVTDKTLGQRIAPLQSAIGLVKDNPGLVTGPSSDNWYNWVQGLATSAGINVGDVKNADAYQQLVKELGRNLLNNGADPTDMARLMREASQPNPTAQGRQALVTLAAEQVGYERIKSMQYREFRSRHPTDANNNSQFYNSETGDFASDLDPKAVAADLIPQSELASYVRGLNPDAQKRFGQTLKDASRLFKFKIPE